jgi:hypothetical protein
VSQPEMVTQLDCLSQSSAIGMTLTHILVVLVFATSFGIQEQIPPSCAEFAQAPRTKFAYIKIIGAYVPIQWVTERSRSDVTLEPLL